MPGKSQMPVKTKLILLKKKMPEKILVASILDASKKNQVGDTEETDARKILKHFDVMVVKS